MRIPPTLVRRPLAWVVAALILAPPAWAQAPQTPEPSDSPDPEAILQEMARTVSGAGAFEVEIDTSWDVVQPTGQKIDVAEVRRVALSRPNKLRADARTAEGGRHGLVYDGDQIAIFDLEENVYSEIEVDEEGVRPALEYFTEKLGMRFPLAELFSPDLPSTLRDDLDEVTYVGEETLEGETWHHVAGRGDVVDVQFWIPTEGAALPGRVVLTYKETPGQPQFRADFDDWDLDPKFRPDEFTFTPRRGAQKIGVTPVVSR